MDSYLEKHMFRFGPSGDSTVAGQARVQAELCCDRFCDHFDEFDLGPFSSYSRRVLEDCDSLWTCFKVKTHKGIKTDRVRDVSRPFEASCKN